MQIANGKTNKLIWKNIQNRYHAENKDISLEHPNVSYSILANCVEECSTVLDIACGEGGWGYQLKKKGCKVYGIDVDDTAIQAAISSGTYETVWNLNIENMTADSQVYQEISAISCQFDYIGMLDILEHTVDPTKALRNAFSFLQENKKILISVPNIGHADIFLNLIEGNFNYQEKGILDNTHTKFFTKRSFAQWIQEINASNPGYKLDCKYLGGTHLGTDYLEDIASKYPNVYSIVQQNPEFNIVQLLFVLTKKKQSEHTPLLDSLIEEDRRVDILQLLEGHLSSDSSVIPILKEHSLQWNERRDFEGRIKEQLSEHIKLQQKIDCLTEQMSKMKDQLDEYKKIGSIVQVETVLQAKTLYIEQKESQIQQLESYLQQLKQASENQSQYTIQKEEQCKQQQQYIEVKEEQIEQLNTYLQELKESVEKQNDYIHVLEEQNVSQQQTLEVTEAEHQKQTAYIKQKEQQIQELNDYLEELKKVLKQQGEYVSEKEKAEQQQQEYIELKEQQIQELTQNLDSNCQHMKEKDTLLSEQKRYMENMEAQSIADKKKAAEQKTRIEYLEKELKKANGTLELIRNSQFWKCTSAFHKNIQI